MTVLSCINLHDALYGKQHGAFGPHTVLTFAYDRIGAARLCCGVIHKLKWIIINVGQTGNRGSHLNGF